MNYQLELNDRPFKAILKGTKKVEGRVPTHWDKTPYEQMKKGDTITFFRVSDRKEMTVAVLYVRHYPDTKTMLESEGTKNVLSSGGNIKQGINSYNSIENYQENIPKYGIYAIGVKSLKE